MCLFVVIAMHPSWFPDTGDGKVKKIIGVSASCPVYQLDARTISIAKNAGLIRIE